MAAGGLLHPQGGPGTVDLARALAAAAGVPGIDLTPHAREIGGRIGDAQHLVFVLVDGLGMNLIEECHEAAYLRAHVAIELRAVYPSSTAPALTSLATCLWPGEHAATGWWTYIPSIGRTITLLPFIDRFGDTPAQDLGLEASRAFPAPVTLAAATRDVASLMPKWIAGSVYTGYTGGGHAVVPYGTLREMVDAVSARIDVAPSATYTYVYVPIVDTAEHTHGPFARETRAALSEAARWIERLSARLSGRARIAVSADHGQMECKGRDKVVLDRHDPLMATLAIPPSCEPRAPAFHCRPAQIEAFPDAFAARFGDEFALLSVEEAAADGLFGPAGVTAETKARLGDYVAVALGTSVLLYEPTNDLRAMRGFHGGMSPEEMRIPLVLI